MIMRQTFPVVKRRGDDGQSSRDKAGNTHELSCAADAHFRGLFQNRTDFRSLKGPHWTPKKSSLIFKTKGH